MTYSSIIMYIKVRTRNGALDRSALVGCHPSRQLPSTERVGRIYMLGWCKHAATQYLHQVSIQVV